MCPRRVERSGCKDTQQASRCAHASPNLDPSLSAATFFSHDFLCFLLLFLCSLFVALFSSGPNVFQGYYKQPAETAESFSVDPQGRRWFMTGDVGTWLPDGSLKMSVPETGAL